ncbi:MAG: glucokinase [Mangrovicoccus sp.]|nr:glucokinase [Mangrovicoccus sp.]
MSAEFTLAADVGGTNTRIALAQGSKVDPQTVRRFPNDDYENLTDLLRVYREDFQQPLRAACVAVAGPVQAGVGRLTNRDWHIAPGDLCAATGAANGYVINDLEAQGHALDHVSGQPVLGQVSTATGTRLVIGVGTGFNAAPVHRTATGLHVAASESGHVSLPIWDADSLRLAEKIQAEFGFASVEEALSGRGLLRLRAHFAGLSQPGLSGQAILSRALSDPASPDAKAAGLMAEILGRVAGDLALIHLPQNGVFLVGGMARALAPWIRSARFEQGYLGKGRFADFMQNFPVALVEDDYAALTGCSGFVMRSA